jgi:hypothetical protein
VRGATENELYEVVQAHLRADHPELVGLMNAEQIWAMAEEE